MLFFGAIGSYFLLLVLYLQNGTGRTAWETGLVLLPYAIGSFITSALSVQLAAKAGRALLVTGAASLAAAQVLLLVLLTDTVDLGYWALAWPLFIGGLGLGLAAPPLIDIIISAVDEHRAGSAAGVLTTFSQVGNALGVAVLGTVFFATLEDAAGVDAVTAHADALAAALPWQIGAYVLAALLMTLLPSRARPEHH
ncbi:MFS transporter [Jiangella muralis]|uniref:MFS transporter n=1 Tax=Jiangella muralis TaxID=702383 RepID=UPI000A707F4C|nr:MFS transporter [Jiangella muralis]